MAKLADDIEAQIDEAMATARDYCDDEMAESITYLRDADLFLLVLRSGTRVAIPREEMQDVAGLSVEAASKVTLEHMNTVVEWVAPPLSVSVKGLAAGLRGNEHWMKKLAERQSPAYAA